MVAQPWDNAFWFHSNCTQWLHISMTKSSFDCHRISCIDGHSWSSSGSDLIFSKRFGVKRRGFPKRCNVTSEVMSLMSSPSSIRKELLETEWKAEQKISMCLCGKLGFAPIQHHDGSIVPSLGPWSDWKKEKTWMIRDMRAPQTGQTHVDCEGGGGLAIPQDTGTSGQSMKWRFGASREALAHIAQN